MVHRTIRALRDGLRNNPYTRVFVLLTATVLLLVGLSALSWCIGCNCNCSDSCDTEQVEEQGKPDIRPQASIQAERSYASPLRQGDVVKEKLRGYVPGETNPGSLTLTYTPPPGATNVQFEGRQPDAQRPDGSYVWQNVPMQQAEGGGAWATDPIEVRFSAPSPPAGETWSRTTSSLGVEHTNGQTDTESWLYTLGTPPDVALRLPDTSPSAQSPPAGAGSQAAAYHLWQVSTWQDIHDEPLTTAICQEWADLAAQTDVFIGVQFPLINATPPYTESYPLPVAFRGEYKPVVKLLDLSNWPFTTVVSIPLEYKHEYEPFLASVMPWADDKRWFALGVDNSSPIVCPPGLNLAADEWEIETRAWLDFGGAEGACAECVLPVYYCYRGQELPEIPGAASQATGLFAATYQGWGITCVGPHLLRLTQQGLENPAFVLEGAEAAAAMPTERVTYTLKIGNLGTTTVNVNLVATSTVGGVWSFYGIDDPPALLGTPVRLDGQPGASWYKEFRVAGNVPAGAAVGSQVVYIAATDAAQPTRKAETTALLWVGDWEPPPPFIVYLPMVTKQ